MTRRGRLSWSGRPYTTEHRFVSAASLFGGSALGDRKGLEDHRTSEILVRRRSVVGILGLGWRGQIGR